MTVDPDIALAAACRAAHGAGLRALFDAEPDRADALSFECAGLHFDFSKLHIQNEVLAAGTALFDAADFEGHRRALLAGDVVNITEGRPAIHAAMRAPQPRLNDPALAQEIADARAGMVAFVQAFARGEIRASDGEPYSHVLHLGIGGSALGPDMLLKAFSGMGVEAKLDAHVVANIDAAALEPALAACDPHRTLIILASKSFTTVETMTNAQTAQVWMESAGVLAPRAQMVAVTAAPQKAADYGLSDAQVLAFPEPVGGRYSIWSAVSLPVALTYGLDAFQGLLSGAAMMDQHFETTPCSSNVCAIAALMDYAYANVMGADSRATFAYDDRLSLLPSYLQQLETESNGKHVTTAGEPLSKISSPAVWGGVGTDAQHAVFQLLHQGQVLVPIEFIAAAVPQHGHVHHHYLLLSNCLAQSAALMKGRTPAQAASALGCAADDPAAIAKSFPGNRPSTTVLMPRLTPETLGALIGFYEHRVFSLAVLLGVNPFDQMGVELGKEMAKQLEPYLGPNAELPDGSVDASTKRLLAYVQAH